MRRARPEAQRRGERLDLVAAVLAAVVGDDRGAAVGVSEDQRQAEELAALAVLDLPGELGAQARTLWGVLREPIMDEVAGQARVVERRLVADTRAWRAPRSVT